MSDDLFGDQHPDEEEEAFEEHRKELALALSDFTEAWDIDEETLSLLLLDAAVSIRSLAYVLSVAKPSEGGLRLEFDRFGRAFGDLIREAKKESGPVLARLREAIAEATKEDPAGDT